MSKDNRRREEERNEFALTKPARMLEHSVTVSIDGLTQRQIFAKGHESLTLAEE